MTTTPGNPTTRIAIAIVLSALLHIILLSSSLIKLPPAKTLPPLTAMLEPLPKIPPRPAPPIKSKKPKPQPVPSAPSTPENVLPDNTLAPQPDKQSEAPSDSQLTTNVPQEEAQSDSDSQAIKDVDDIPVEAAQPGHVFPKLAQLTFVVYKGRDFEIGEVRHRLEISDDKNYLLKVGVNTTGIASIFKPFELNQQSSGIITDQGLRPFKYNETKNTSKGKETSEALFSWDEKLLILSNGNNTPLPERSQDIISFLYQLPLLSPNKGTILMHISNGRKLEQYQLAVGEEEIIQTRLGRLRTLRLNKIHATGEEGMDIWLGLEYRLLPVKISLIDRAEHVSGEMVISEILVADK